LSNNELKKEATDTDDLPNEHEADILQFPKPDVEETLTWKIEPLTADKTIKEKSPIELFEFKERGELHSMVMYFDGTAINLTIKIDDAELEVRLADLMTMIANPDAFVEPFFVDYDTGNSIYTIGLIPKKPIPYKNRIGVRAEATGTTSVAFKAGFLARELWGAKVKPKPKDEDNSL